MAWFSEQIKSQMEERYGDEVKSKIDTRKAGKKIYNCSSCNKNMILKKLPSKRKTLHEMREMNYFVITWRTKTNTIQTVSEEKEIFPRRD